MTSYDVQPQYPRVNPRLTAALIFLILEQTKAHFHLWACCHIILYVIWHTRCSTVSSTSPFTSQRAHSLLYAPWSNVSSASPRSSWKEDVTHSFRGRCDSLTRTKIIMKWKLAFVCYVNADVLCVKIVGFKAKICHLCLVRNCWNKSSILYGTSCRYVCDLFFVLLSSFIKIRVRRQMAVWVLNVWFGDKTLFKVK